MTKLKELNTPVFAAEGVLDLDRSSYRLNISGLVNAQNSLLLDDIKNKLPQSAIDSRLTSVSGWSVRVTWNGVLWDDLLNVIQPSATAKYVLFTSAGDYTTSVWLNDLTGTRAMLVWGVAGESLENEYGGPVRMIIPNLWGYKSCKWLTSIEFREKYIPGYWEMRGYTHRGNIEPGETYDVNSQSYRPIRGGEVIDF